METSQRRPAPKVTFRNLQQCLNYKQAMFQPINKTIKPIVAIWANNALAFRWILLDDMLQSVALIGYQNILRKCSVSA